MNKENAHLYLPLVQALAEGKTIQLRYSSGNWTDHSNPDFSLHPVNYRIKPVPEVVYLNITKHNVIYTHNTEEGARNSVAKEFRNLYSNIAFPFELPPPDKENV